MVTAWTLSAGVWEMALDAGIATLALGPGAASPALQTPFFHTTGDGFALAFDYNGTGDCQGTQEL